MLSGAHIVSVSCQLIHCNNPLARQCLGRGAKFNPTDALVSECLTKRGPTWEAHVSSATVYRRANGPGLIVWLKQITCKWLLGWNASRRRKVAVFWETSTWKFRSSNW